MDEVLLAVESSDPWWRDSLPFATKFYLATQQLGALIYVAAVVAYPDEFFAHCRALQRSPKHEDATGNLQLLLSALDFEAFCELMTQEAIQTQIALKEAEDMGL
ncbi:ADP-ribosylation factor-like 2-binding protein, domain [Phytophthora cactorum]|nr:ADP-ribosylation factor-like 2-binding protein, domain [Phytophthora cactorum]